MRELSLMQTAKKEELKEKVTSIYPLGHVMQEVFNEVAEEMCDKICKYTHSPIPEGKDSDWLYNEDSPCLDCPMMKISFE